MRNLAQHWRGFNAFLLVRKRERAGLPILVEQAEAEKRAAICSPCQKNDVKASVSKIEEAEDAEMAKLVEGRTVEKADELGHCKVCSCHLKALVHVVPEIVMHKVDAKHMKKYPANCWKHTL